MITLIKNKTDLKNILQNNKNQKSGFVPTMGNLHEGHVSLIQKSLVENDITYISIFVNPTQFAPNEDFNKYPRTLENDLEKIKKLDNNSNIVIFAPDKTEDIYPSGFNTNIQVKSFNHQIEGAFRPTHFDGVATVVFKLLNLFKPDCAYFGQKDYQQFLVIKKLCQDLEIDTNIIMMPIVRDHDGLALSSRNQYLDQEQRKEALTLRNTLLKIEDYVSQGKITEAIDFSKSITKDKKWNYLEIKDANNLEDINNETKEIIILGLYQQGNTRLLDNILVKR